MECTLADRRKTPWIMMAGLTPRKPNEFGQLSLESDHCCFNNVFKMWKRLRTQQQIANNSKDDNPPHMTRAFDNLQANVPHISHPASAPPGDT